MDAPQLNLAHELLHLTRVLEAARLLVDQLGYEAFVNECDRLALPAATSAVLVLLDCRMRLLRQVLAGEASPRVLCAAHNADSAPGVVLAWDATRELRHAEAELERARARQAAQHVVEGS